MTYRFGRTNKLRYAATISGIPAYDNGASLKPTDHLIEPAVMAPAAPPTGNRAPLQGVRPVQTTVPGLEYTGWPSDPDYGCGEDDGRKYSRTPKRKKPRRRRGKATLRRARRKAAVLSGSAAQERGCEKPNDCYSTTHSMCVPCPDWT